MQWRKSQESDNFDEEAYFNEAVNTYKPTTLWSTYSILETTLNCNHHVGIAKYARLMAFLKKKKDAFQSNKWDVFTAEKINKFLDEAPDSLYLGMQGKTILSLCFYIFLVSKTRFSVQAVFVGAPRRRVNEIVVRI